MAASGEQAALGQLGQEATCPLCLDFFEQPMVLSCGHNFCRDCLAQLGTEPSCPQCRAKVEPGSACPNWALANIVGHLKRLQLSEGADEESSGHGLCQEQGQPLEIFCSSEKSLLCPGCLGGHPGHRLLSLPEAAHVYKMGRRHRGARLWKSWELGSPNSPRHSISSLGQVCRKRGHLKFPERWEDDPGSRERPTKATS